MKIGSAVWAVREPQKMVKKNFKKGQQRYISRVAGGGTPMGGMMKLGIFIDPPDVMNHASFHLYMMNTLRPSGGSKKGFCL